MPGSVPAIGPPARRSPVPLGLGWRDAVVLWRRRAPALIAATAFAGLGPLTTVDASAGPGTISSAVAAPATVNEQAKLTASDAGASDHLGSSVATAGDTTIVGAPGDDGAGADMGAAYVFVRTGTTWSQQAKLIAADAAAFDDFGYAVAITGDTVVIGAPGDDGAGVDMGAAYVFVRTGTTWSQQAKLTAADGAAFDDFGYAVAITGDTVVTGSPSDTDAGPISGSAYVFVRTGTTWSQQAKLTASDAATFDAFGFSVAASSDTAVIGSPSDGDAGTSSGSAYVFVRTGTSWSQQAKLTASDAATFDVFGHAVSVSGQTTVIGARLDDDGGSASGSAYRFTRQATTWSEEAKLTGSDGGQGDQLGSAVAVADGTSVVGAPYEDGGTDTGAAYVFASTPSPVPTLRVGDTMVTEGDTTATFVVTLSSPAAEPVKVGTSTRDGTARQPGDYVLSRTMLRLAPGQTTATVSVDIVDDDQTEPGETFTLALFHPVGATIADGTATATISDDD